MTDLLKTTKNVFNAIWDGKVVMIVPTVKKTTSIITLIQLQQLMMVPDLSGVLMNPALTPVTFVKNIMCKPVKRIGKM